MMFVTSYIESVGETMVMVSAYSHYLASVACGVWEGPNARGRTVQY
jgi:hypothetical protein